MLNTITVDAVQAINKDQNAVKGIEIKKNGTIWYYTDGTNYYMADGTVEKNKPDTNNRP